MAYAKGTQVEVDRSIEQIRRLVMRYDADEFGYLQGRKQAAIIFTMRDRRIHIEIPLPDRTAREFTHTPGRDLERDDAAAFKAWDQACRERWRSLALIVQAKLEVVEVGVRAFEQEFALDFVMPNGRTVYDQMMPDLDRALASGKLQPLLPERE